MPSRRLLAPLLLAALIAASAVGCAPEPTPTPTPTGWASEDEAFAAAEETYRAYVDALNQVDLADPATFEPVYEWLTDDALNDEKKSLTGMHADGWTVTGASTVGEFFHETLDPAITTIACLNVSAVDVVDEGGISQVGDDRPDVYSMELTFADAADSPTRLRVAQSVATDDPRCQS